MKELTSNSLHTYNINNKLRQKCLAKTCHTSKYAQQDAGFTLIELTVVALIIGILAAIVAPSWLGFLSRQRVNKANDAVLAALQEAQRQAKRTKRSYSVSFKVESGLPMILIHQDTVPPASGWNNLGENMGFNPNQVLLYSNTNTTTYNTKNATGSVVNTAPGSGTITFDYMGVLASKGDNSIADTPLKIMVAAPQPGTTAASELRRCVIAETLLGGMRTAKDTQCN
ncbi:prepilin-type N-terminal cleavage/methylation domain-containing protein [Nostocales cyanobacterium LEGE 11386]|nr:prepilin-type N-terminal cleavage/methylation domain-containing protein [Nostocales cyanobacterium LEGE 11386]